LKSSLFHTDQYVQLEERTLNFLVVLFISYEAQNTGVIINRVQFIPIEFLSWDYLTIGAPGWGQIQIANSNFITIQAGYSRKAWMIELCDNLLDFYPREINKINQRIDYFRKVRASWESRLDE
jgi:hypothetical protein